MTCQVGITGGIGSGKTLVCSILEKLGVPVYHADDQARRLMDTDESLKEGIKELLGARAYQSGKLDRSFVADRVFPDPGRLERLNALVHPVVREDYREWVKRRPGAEYVVEEAAILFESGASRFLDRTVLVYAPEALRIERVMKRDGISEREVRLRMDRQMDDEEKRKLADYVIVNDERSMLLPQIIHMHNDILQSI